MRKMLLKLIVVFILVCNLTANAEGNMHSLRISYFPAELCGRSDSFVPSETAQNELLALIDAIEFRNMTDYDGAWPDRAAPICEITLEYNGYTAFLRGDGWIRVNDASIGIWLAQDSRVMDYVLNLLAQRGYQPLDPDDLRNLEITRAELFDGEYYTGEKHAPIIIEDTAKLATLEAIICGAVLTESSGCPFGYAKLIVTTTNGNEYTLYPATDSCPRFFVNGSFFNYDAHIEDDFHDTNQELFGLFGIVAADYFHSAQ